jgi:hypothetical protein
MVGLDNTKGGCLKSKRRPLFDLQRSRYCQGEKFIDLQTGGLYRFCAFQRGLAGL